MDVDQLNQLAINNLRSLIAEKGFTPTRLAKEAGLGYTSVRDILTGNSASPRYITLLKLAHVLGVDPRCITIGADFQSVDEQMSEAVDLLSQLNPEDRNLLLTALKMKISSQNSLTPQANTEGR